MKTIENTTKSQNLNRFDVRTLGLSDEQLRKVAGALPPEKTSETTVVGVTRCCWG